MLYLLKQLAINIQMRTDKLLLRYEYEKQDLWYDSYVF
jgi:hypothetical protein